MEDLTPQTSAGMARALLCACVAKVEPTKEILTSGPAGEENSEAVLPSEKETETETIQGEED
ncbi:MAG: hypothetical protein PHF18_03780 [Methanosarcina sp.]|uniref:hypothetical protein n=1 Tax=Methanosarcina sp. TaxID=2213 RepID=UPI00262A9919|nr:hypothetical protein [Methanosarcina sp.]MDD3245970.1 hypothetical protein [Methanosarcina sp.]